MRCKAAIDAVSVATITATMLNKIDNLWQRYKKLTFLSFS